jgi:mannosyltransferase OCH1-like enzyme
MKNKYNSIIPFNIFQTWHSKKIPVRMMQNILSIKKNNPGFQYFFFDDQNCDKFIEKNYGPDVIQAYRKLIPGAYKADMWRYCVLYKMGGIYLDIKYGSVNHFKFINLTEKEHWVLDKDGDKIYNALIVSKPGNPILWKAIQKIVENVKNRYYGNGCLDPTGPGLLTHFFTREEKNKLDMKHEVLLGDFNNRIINFNNIPVLRSYHGYLDDHKHFKNVEYYSDLWHQRRIYR